MRTSARLYKATSWFRASDLDIYHRWNGPKSAPLFGQVNWQVQDDQRWAIIGRTGSGKSSLIKALRGLQKVEPVRGCEFPFLDGSGVWPEDVIKEVGFEGATGPNVSSYMAERYHSYRESTDKTLREWLQDGTQHPHLDNVARSLSLQPLLDASLMNLSNGQSRRAKIAKILLSHPRVLILDEPFMGLDTESRVQLDNVLGKLAMANDPAIVLGLRPQDPLPDWITHLCYLEPRVGSFGSEMMLGPREEILPIVHERHALQKGPSLHERIKLAKAKLDESQQGRVLVQTVDLCCSYYNRPVLVDINWTVREGERWALVGHNGSGKTTLIAMISGDHPKSYASEIYMFGRRRGTGESVFDVQQQIGHSSPEVHSHFPKHYTGFETIFSAYMETFQITRAPSGPERARVDKMIGEFGLQELADRSLGLMSNGEQRMFLLCRALVKQSPLIILDEPFQGMDEGMIQTSKRWIDERLDCSQALICITHDQDHELPLSTNRYLSLSNGHIQSTIYYSLFPIPIL